MVGGMVEVEGHEGEDWYMLVTYTKVGQIHKQSMDRNQLVTIWETKLNNKPRPLSSAEIPNSTP